MYIIKRFLKTIRDKYHLLKIHKSLNISRGKADNFEFDKYREGILNYLSNQKQKGSNLFVFSSNKDQTDIYSNTYALLMYGLLGVIESINVEHAFEYIYKSQSADGFFRDQKLQCELAEKGHYWGWHHLAPHVIIALGYLNQKPKYDFNKVIDVLEKNTMSSWLASLDWKDNYLLTSNQILNVGVMLQYSRDYFHNDISKKLIDELKVWLIDEKFDKTKIIKNIDINKSKYEISKSVKAIYHIAPLFIYDNEYEKLPISAILRYALLTQNKIGGYGPNILTDACQDIDSLFLLSELSNNKNVEVMESINMFFKYVFLNQNKDKGFSFKAFHNFIYGDQHILSSGKNESNLFATWFRTLSVAYTCEYLEIQNNFVFSKCPGYQFKRKNNHV